MQEGMGARPGEVLGAAEPRFWWPAEGLLRGNWGKTPWQDSGDESYELEEPGIDSQAGHCVGTALGWVSPPSHPTRHSPRQQD